MKYILKILKASRPFKWPILTSILCQLVYVALMMGYVFVSKALVDIATGRGSMDVKSGLLTFALIFLGIIVIRTLVNGFKTFLQTKASTRMKNVMRQEMFDNILHLSVDVRGKFHSGDILNRIKEDVSTVASTCCVTIPAIIGAGAQFVAAFIYLLCIQPKLAWILVVILPVGIFAGKYLMMKIRDLSLAVRNDDSKVHSHLQESIQHQTLIKSMEYDSYSVSTLGGLQDDLYDKTMKRTRFMIWARIIISLTLGIAYATAFLWGVFGISKGTITYGLMTAFLQLVGQLQRPLLELGDQLPGFFHSTASIDRLDEINALPLEDSGDPKMLQNTAGIRLNDVSFRYDDNEDWVLKDFSHDFAPGTKTAILGPTGIGKSTTVKLMLSLLSPQSGSIELYDNEGNILPAGPSSRCNLVYVPQGNSLFSGTIRENLLMGNPDASQEELLEALHTAAADFVNDLPQGLDTQCFESGGGLSEGQAQRIAIARGLLRPGSILLLDELTSALDPATEALMLQRLTSTMEDRTMIFITHREKIAEYCKEKVLL